MPERLFKFEELVPGEGETSMSVSFYQISMKYIFDDWGWEDIAMAGFLAEEMTEAELERIRIEKECRMMRMKKSPSLSI